MIHFGKQITDEEKQCINLWCKQKNKKQKKKKDKKLQRNKKPYLNFFWFF